MQRFEIASCMERMNLVGAIAFLILIVVTVQARAESSQNNVSVAVDGGKENDSIIEGAGELRLFMTEEEQLTAESAGQDDLTVGLSGDSPETVISKPDVDQDNPWFTGLIEPDSAIGAVTEPKLSKEKNSSVNDLEDSDAARYNGIVMKGDKVLGLWINSRPFNNRKDGKGLRVDAIDADGRIQIAGAGGSADLYPGELIPDYVESSEK